MGSKQKWIHAIIDHKKEYSAWKGMLRRCYNEDFAQFKDYGGRGILVCSNWLSSFDQFMEDMGKSPIGSQLDRIDNNGSYSPDNCRWVSRNINNHNKRVLNRKNGKGLRGASLCRKYGNWRSTIKIGGIHYPLGTFKTEEQAHLMYQCVERYWYGTNYEDI